MTTPTYRSALVTRRGGPETIELALRELRPPTAREVRVRMLAASLTADDVANRIGNRPTLSPLPFVPGYAIIGEVDALGPDAAGLRVGDHVAALLQIGGHAEYLYIDAAALCPVPASLDPIKAAPLILNYLVAYQVLHRVSGVKEGQSALVVGASGGVGTALLELGRVAGLRMYGLASPRKHADVAALGATPIDYHGDVLRAIRAAAPDGVDCVFNGMADEYFGTGVKALRRGGVLVHYGGPQSMWGLVALIAKLLFFKIWPNGKDVRGYGTHRVPHAQRAADWAALFGLLADGAIDPKIAAVYPLSEIVAANEHLERGDVVGTIVIRGDG